MTKFSNTINKIFELCPTLTNEEFARVADVSIPTIERWRDGSTEPHSLMMLIILKSLDEMINLRKLE